MYITFQKKIKKTKIEKKAQIIALYNPKEYLDACLMPYFDELKEEVFF